MVAVSNKYEEGSPEDLAYNEGVDSERARLLKVLNKYHSTFCSGELSDHMNCDKTMQIRYLYEFIAESRKLK